MIPILFQIEAIRKLTRRQWATNELLHAVAAALKELALEVDRTLANRLEAEAAQAWQAGDLK
jgi:hypothetical protein